MNAIRRIVVGNVPRHTAGQMYARRAERALRVRALLAVAIGALLILASVAGRAQDARAPATVEVARVSNARLQPVRWVPGSVVSRDDARIASAEAGRLKYVAEVGTRVKAGERIAQLDDEASRLRREEIRAEVRRADAQRKLAATQLDRLNKLSASNAIAKTQIDEARATFETDVQTLAQVRAQLRQVEHDIDQADVRAPFTGIVTERFAQRGEYVQVGAAILHLVDTDHIEARVEAPLAMAASIHAGMDVRVRSQGKETATTVRAVVPVGDERARQFELRVALTPTQALVGSAVEVALPETAGGDALTIPRDAIVRRQNETYVMRITPQSTAERVPVTPGDAAGNRIQVHGALVPGDRLVVRGAERLSPGQAIRVEGGG